MKTRSKGAALALLLGFGLAGCTANAPDTSKAPEPVPGDDDYLPPQAEACDFMLGPDSADFAAFTARDLTGFTVVEDAASALGREASELEALRERDGLLCVKQEQSSGARFVFAWAPIGESEREEVIGHLERQGLERTETEGGTVLREGADVTAPQHLVTNMGWYFSSEERGTLYLRSTFED